MTESTRRLFVVIPAAGFSRRMGQPKLLLRLNQQSIIQRLVNGLDHPQVSTISVLVRRDDSALMNEVQQLNVSLVTVDAPTSDMKESVRFLTEHLAVKFAPTDQDGWLLIPADHPIVMPKVIETLIDAWMRDPKRVILPSYENRRGHPVIFPWRLTREFDRIPEDQGLNWLLKQPDVEVNEVAMEEPSVLWDLDTPDDFERIRTILEN